MSSESPVPMTRRERRAALRKASERTSIRTPGGGRPGPDRFLVVSLLGAVIALAIIALAVLGSRPSATLPPLATPLAAVIPAPELVEGRMIGDPDAPLLIEVFEDAQCPFCGRYARDGEPLLIAEYVRDGRVRIVHSDLAFLGPESLDAAAAMHAAERVAPGSFFRYRAALYANQVGENRGAFSRDRLIGIARLLSLPVEPFVVALDDPALRDAIVAEGVSARARGVDSTPTLIIGGRIHEGPATFEALRVSIDAALAALPAPVPSPAPTATSAPDPSPGPSATAAAAAASRAPDPSPAPSPAG